jgi:hypothetical protein
MKSNVLAVLLFGLLVGCGKGSGSGGGMGGDEGAKGGDIVAQQAALIITDVVTQVSAMPEVFPEVDQNRLADAASRVRILVREHTYANGVETDAMNNGHDRIDLNMSRWNRAVIYDRRLAILAHELFGLVGAEPSASYNVSRRILVEGRFNSNRLYECFGASSDTNDYKQLRCTVRLLFNGSRHSFTTGDVNCDYPGIIGFAHDLVYSYVDGKVYSTHDGCTYPEPGDSGQGMCNRSPGTGREYDTLEFQRGYSFTFSGLMIGINRYTIGCRAVR